MLLRVNRLLFVVGVLLLIVACERVNDSERFNRDDQLRLNQIQVLGTHNSFHPFPVDEPMASIVRKHFSFFVGYGEYRHKPVGYQLEALGVRQFEFDVFADPEGGRFSHRPLLATIGEPTARNIPELDEPGFKVLHLIQIDPESTCWSLIACLQEIKKWSDANPKHVPIMIMLEIKDVDFLGVGHYIPLPRFTEQDYADLDAEILTVFPREQLITPDQVQGNYASLEEAVLNKAWPSLADSYGKVLFTQYHGKPHENLRGRIAFPDYPVGNPNAAFVILDDAIKDFETIKTLVGQGYLVRTRSDIDLVEAKNNDYTRLEMALASGAQFISTDVPEANEMINPDFSIQIPGGMPARCNPVTAPKWCSAAQIEDLSSLSH